jgi:Family of unknown function (DUF6282)
MNGTLIDVAGAIDLHCHPYPDLFPRLADDVGIARYAQTQGLRAVMIKCHHENSVSRAYLTQQIVPDLKLFGGVVLNSYVGGLNPAAVEAALRLGGKEVWMPTIDSSYHAKMHGSTGAYDSQASGEASKPGISAIDAEGNLIPEAIEILDLVAKHNAILGTCHLSPKEITLLVETARQRGVQKILITHPFFKVPNLDIETLEHLASLGAYAEFGYCTVSPMWNYASLKKVAGAINVLGSSSCVLVSDAGQRHNPMPAEALRLFAQGLFESGVAEEDIYKMIRDNPADLLELGPPESVEPAAGSGAS